jgi:hypothetical protein
MAKHIQQGIRVGKITVTPFLGEGQAEGRIGTASVTRPFRIEIEILRIGFQAPLDPGIAGREDNAHRNDKTQA